MVSRLNASRVIWTFVFSLVLVGVGNLASNHALAASPFDKIDHIIVIYQENWSFDGLYGKFPGAEGLDKAGDASLNQLKEDDTPYVTLPQPQKQDENEKDIDDKRFPSDLPVKPFDWARWVKPEGQTGDLIHKFFHEQYQINGGKMNKFVAWTNAGGLVMSYYDASNMPEGKLAQEFVMCDKFFHAAYGGSFLNHFWLIAADTPRWDDAPESLISVAKDGKFSEEKPLWRDESSPGKPCYAVNTIRSVYPPYKKGKVPTAEELKLLLPPQTMTTIVDRLDEADVSWAWYAGGWNDALAGKPDPTYQFHHHPLAYFEKFKDGSPGRKEHLVDETDFAAAISAARLPAVSFIKPLGIDNEHPGYATLVRGQQHVADLVKLVRDSDYWKSSMIIVTYDENGGRWDHVSPPTPDRWGCGTRVPTIVISPFAKKKFVDHTSYDTTSVLRTIEARFDLKPLTSRDRDVNDLRNTLE